MTRFLANRLVEICGLVTSVATAIVILLIEEWLNFSFFTLTFWVVIPVGAIVTGCLAASGYYFGAVWTNRRPSKSLLVSMVIIAGGTFFLIYYLQYVSLTIDGKAVRDFVPFSVFLQVVLTKASYGLTHAPKATIEVGSFGYVIGAVQFLAFMVGGLGVYLALAAKPFCNRCEKYLKNLIGFSRTFEDSSAFEQFGNRLYSLSPPSADYLTILKESHTVKSPKPGAISIEWSLLGCPECRSQLVIEKPRVFNTKNEWADVSKLAREFRVDAGIPLSGDFASAKRGLADH